MVQNAIKMVHADEPPLRCLTSRQFGLYCELFLELVFAPRTYRAHQDKYMINAGYALARLTIDSSVQRDT